MLFKNESCFKGEKLVKDGKEVSRCRTRGESEESIACRWQTTQAKKRRTDVIRNQKQGYGSVRTCGFYRPQTKFAKVMFLHVSVILSTGREGGCLGPDPGGRLGVLARGVSRSRPGGSRPWGGPGLGGPGLGPGGRCIPACTETDPPLQMATAADGTHPTGMHSFFVIFFCRHVWTVPSVTIQHISKVVLMTQKVCVAIAKCERTVSVSPGGGAARQIACELTNLNQV